MEPGCNGVGDVPIIEVGHHEMRIPFDADIGQADDFLQGRIGTAIFMGRTIYQ